jgi:nucleotide-binding universal stress UspA family protein
VSDLVLVATDGGRAAASALRFAVAYGEAENLDVEIISVVEPLSELPMPLPHREELEYAHARGVAERVGEHLRDVVGPVDWPVHVRLGRPAPAICQAAVALGARMIILGLDCRKPEANSTAVELLHLAETPVYVATEPKLPTVAVVGIDFRPSSLRAAREALRLTGPQGVLHLAHVQPALDFPAASVWDWSECYDGAVTAGFEKLIAELKDLGARNISTHRRVGDAAAELLSLGEELGANLLAVGSDGYICNGRVVVGRVARRLIVDPPISLLATPVLTDADGIVMDVCSAKAARTAMASAAAEPAAVL